MSLLGQTEYIGQNSNLSYHGHRLGRLKSLIQKSVRRRDKKIINWVAFEIASFHRLYLFLDRVYQKVKQANWKDIISEYDRELVLRVMPKKFCSMDTTDPKRPKKMLPVFSTQKEWLEWIPGHLSKIASALRNVAHRILIISTEDCFDIWIPGAIDDDMRTISQKPDHPEYGVILCRVLHRLIDSNKVRLVSDIKSTYLLKMANKPYNQKFVDRYHELRENPELFGFDKTRSTEIKKVLDIIHEEDHSFSKNKQDSVTALLSNLHVKLNGKSVKQGPFHLSNILKESDEISRYSMGIIYHLLYRSDQVFYWVKKLMDSTHSCRYIGRRKKSIYLIWLIMTHIHQLEKPRKSGSVEWIRLKMVRSMILKLKRWYDDGNLGGLTDMNGKIKGYILPEANLFLYYSITVYIRQDWLDDTGGYVLPLEPSPLQLHDIPSLAQFDLLSNDHPEIPGYARDMHDISSKQDINGWIQREKEILAKKSESELYEYLPSILAKLESIQSYQTYFDSIKEKIISKTITRSEIETYLASETRNTVHFAKYGAFVVGENSRLCDTRYRDIYNILKGILPENLPSISSDLHDDKQISLPDLDPIIGDDESGHCIQDIGVVLISKQKQNDILDAIRGQKLCGKGKIPVAVYRNHIVKGPYHFDRPGDQLKFRLNIANTQAITELEKSIPECSQSSIPWKCALQVESTSIYYLVMKNVGSKVVHLMDSSEADTSIEQGKKIVCRGSLVDSVSDHLDQCKDDDVGSRNVINATLQHLYFRYILGIGDSNLRNVLVRRDRDTTTQKKYVAGIDLEEIRRSFPPPNSSRFQLMLANSHGRGLPKKSILQQLEPKVDGIEALQMDPICIDALLDKIYGQVFDQSTLSKFKTDVKNRKHLFEIA